MWSVEKFSVIHTRASRADGATKCFRMNEIMVIDVEYNQGGFVENSNSITIVNGITWVVFT